MKKYIVYIAFLTLLVSCNDHAAVERAFLLDSTLKHNNEIVDKGTESTIESICHSASEKRQLKPFADAAQKLPKIIEPLLYEIMETRVTLSNPSGIYLYEGEHYGCSIEARKARYEKEGFNKFEYSKNKWQEGRPMRVFNKTTPYTVLFKKGRLAKLQSVCRKTKIELYQQLDSLVKSLAEHPIRGVDIPEKEVLRLKKSIDKMFPDSANLTTLFKAATLADCYPILRKIESQSKNTVILMVEFLDKHKGELEPIYDKYEVLTSSEKPYILLGETYKSEIALGAFSSQAEFSVEVNGETLQVEKGKAAYVTCPRSVGTHIFMATFNVINALTGEVDRIRKNFIYEVGTPAVFVENSTMNIFYTGVDNPISVAAAGLSFNDFDVRIFGAGGTLAKIAGGKYSVKVTKQTGAGEFCNIDIWNRKTGKKMHTYPFQVKRIPDPIVKLSNANSATVLSPTNMHKQRGLMAVLENFDFNGVCSVEKYELLYIPQDGDIQKIANNGEAFVPEAKAWVQAAKPGDQYLFMDIEVRCPGDSSNRKMGSMGVVVE